MTRLATDAEIAELREGLEGVTPGPWQTGRLGDIDLSHVVDFGAPPRAPFMIMRPASAYGVCHADDSSSPKNAAHVARCSPDFISALLARLDAQESALREAREIVSATLAANDDGPGLLDCIDNDGGRYPSQFLADAIETARAWLAKQEPEPSQTSKVDPPERVVTDQEFALLKAEEGRDG